MSRLDALLAEIIRNHSGPVSWLTLAWALSRPGLSKSHAESVIHHTPLLKHSPNGYHPHHSPRLPDHTCIDPRANRIVLARLQPDMVVNWATKERVELTTRGTTPNHVGMAQKVIVELTDDIDGKPAAETLSFGLDGRTYEIDLSAKNAKALRKELEPWIGSARRLSGRKIRTTITTSGASSSTGVDNKAVRAWAASNGIELSARGRIPGEVIEKYRAAGN